MLRNANLTFIPDFIENKLDDQIVDLLAGNDSFRHIYAFIEAGGWFVSTAFAAWLTRKLDEGHTNG